MEVIKEYSGEELLRAIRSDEKIDRPIKFIYRKHFESLSKYIQQNNGNEQDGEDIFQEAVLNFIELVRLNKFRGESSVKTFLYAVNRNIWLNELKKRGRQEKHHLKFGAEQSPAEQNIETYINKRETRMEIVRIIEELGEACRKILILFYYDNFSINDILKKMDYQNEQVVRNKKSKCMKSLEKKLLSDPELERLFKTALQYE